MKRWPNKHYKPYILTPAVGEVGIGSSFALSGGVKWYPPLISVVNLLVKAFNRMTLQKLDQPALCFGTVKMTWQSCRGLMVVLAVLLLSSVATGEELTTGSSSRKLRQEVVKQIPWAQLNVETKAKIADVVDKPNMYRSLPRMAIQIDPDYLHFLIRHPEVVVNIWELMGITDMKAKRIAPYRLQTDDGAGTTSEMELVYGSNDTHIYYGEGQYEGPVLRKKLTARCVVVVRTSPRNQGLGLAGQTAGVVNKDRQMVCQLDVFLKIPNAAAGLIVRTIQPIVGPTADHNFSESMKFLQRLNETTEENGYGVQEMGKRLSVSRPVQEKFISVAGDVHQRAVSREAKGNEGKYNVDFGGSQPSPAASGAASPIGAHPLRQTGYPVRQSGYTGRPSAQRLQSYVPGNYQYPTRSAPVTRSGYFGGGQRAQFSDQRR